MMTSIHLPLRTNRTMDGPFLRFAFRDLAVYYDCENDDGSVQWARVRFYGVIAFQHTEWTMGTPTTSGWHESMFLSNESEWRKTLLTKWSRRIGDDNIQKEKGGAARFTHYSLYFEDRSTLDVLAEGHRDSSIVDDPGPQVLASPS
jgi:hypothetical protein